MLEFILPKTSCFEYTPTHIHSEVKFANLSIHVCCTKLTKHPKILLLAITMPVSKFRSVVGFSSRRHGFNLKITHNKYTVYKVTVRKMRFKKCGL